MSKAIGAGLPWPESIHALVNHYGGSYSEVARHINIDRTDLRNYNIGRHKPRLWAAREKFFLFGWPAESLPPGRNTPPKVVSEADIAGISRNERERDEVAARVAIYERQADLQRADGVYCEDIRLEYVPESQRLT